MLRMTDEVRLPEPLEAGPVPVEAALRRRRSVRRFADGPLAPAEVARLLWAAQGITDPDGGLRTAPSAGALYPLELCLVAGELGSLPPGVYRYQPHRHALRPAGAGDRRAALAAAALSQDWIVAAPAVVAIAAVYGRTTATYGARGRRYVQLEAGHAAANLCLQAAALGLGTIVVGAFRDAEVARLLELAADEEPLCLLPIGRA